MHIRFADADQNFISEQTKYGYYTNETEVVRDAVRRLREQKEAQQTPFTQAVMKGHEQIEQGLTTPFTRALMEQIDAEAVSRVASGEKLTYSPEVIALSEHE